MLCSLHSELPATLLSFSAPVKQCSSCDVDTNSGAELAASAQFFHNTQNKP